MSRHRLQEAPTAEATVELVAAPRTRRASSKTTPPPAGELDRAALAKEILAAVDQRIPLSEDVRTGETIGGNRPVADAIANTDEGAIAGPDVIAAGRAGAGAGMGAGSGATSGADAGAARGSRHRRPPAASGARWGRGRGRSVFLITGLVVGLAAVPTVGLAAADPCRLRQAAHQLILDLGGTQAPSDPCSPAAEVGAVEAVATTATDDLSFDRRARASARPTPSPTTRPTTAAAPPPVTSSCTTGPTTPRCTGR